MLRIVKRLKEEGGDWVLDIQVKYPRPSSDGLVEIILADDTPQDVINRIDDIAQEWRDVTKNWGTVEITRYSRYLHDVARAFIDKEVGFADLKEAVAMYK